MARSAPIQQADGSFGPSESDWESYREWAEQIRRQRDEADQLEERRA